MAAQNSCVRLSARRAHAQSAVLPRGSLSRVFATHFVAFVASSYLSFALCQALGWGPSAALLVFSLPHAIALSANFVGAWLPHAILLASNIQVRRANPLVTGAAGAFTIIAFANASELLMQKGIGDTSVGAFQDSGYILLFAYAGLVTLSLLSVCGISYEMRRRLG